MSSSERELIAIVRSMVAVVEDVDRRVKDAISLNMRSSVNMVLVEDKLAEVHDILSKIQPYADVQ